MSLWRYNFQISEESSNPQHSDRKPLKRNCVLTVEELYDTVCQLENSPKKVCGD
jgi:hypothetical protein